MSTTPALIASTLAAAMAFGTAIPAFAQTAQRDTAAHEHSAAAPAKLTLDRGKKWTTDEPLRKGMAQIRTLMAGKLEAIHQGKLTADGYKALGAGVEQQVANIVAQCKLPAEADAMLHLVVADLLAGADTMKGNSAGKPAEGAHKVVVAMNDYGRYFDHPGWKPLN